MYTKINEYFNNKNSVLVAVDIQKRFVGQKFINNIIEYSKEFTEVYQIFYGDEFGIYDTGLDYSPDVKLPNEVGVWVKGLNFYEYAVDKILWDEDTLEKLENDDYEIGDSLELPDNSNFSGMKMVKISDGQWFLITNSLNDLYQSLKDKKIVLVGGGVGECLDDVYVSMKSFGLNVKINKKYTYCNM